MGTAYSSADDGRLFSVHSLLPIKYIPTGNWIHARDVKTTDCLSFRLSSHSTIPTANINQHNVHITEYFTPTDTLIANAAMIV